MMLSVQYIIGQLDAPISQIIGFVQQTQDARISLERLAEIHGKDDEEAVDSSLITEIPKDKALLINNLSFSLTWSEAKLFWLSCFNSSTFLRFITLIDTTAVPKPKTRIIKIQKTFFLIATPNQNSLYRNL